jgi:hypothetical protein
MEEDAYLRRPGGGYGNLHGLCIWIYSTLEVLMNIKILGTGCAKCHALERPEFIYKP